MAFDRAPAAALFLGAGVLELVPLLGVLLQPWQRRVARGSAENSGGEAEDRAPRRARSDPDNTH